MINSEQIPELVLEQYILGELSQAKLIEVQQALLNSESLRARVAKIRRSNENFSLPLRQTIDLASEPYSTHSPSNWENFFSNRNISLALISCLIVIFLSPMLTLENTSLHQDISQESYDIRLKGIQPQIKIYRQVGNNIDQVLHDEMVGHFEKIQLGYISGGKKYGVVFSLDGRGEVTLHYPEKESASTVLDKSGEHSLAYAYELDDAPLYERFFFITSDEPISVEKILRRGKALATEGVEVAKSGDLFLGEAVDQISVLLNKEPNQ